MYPTFQGVILLLVVWDTEHCFTFYYALVAWSMVQINPIYLFIGHSVPANLNSQGRHYPEKVKRVLMTAKEGCSRVHR